MSHPRRVFIDFPDGSRPVYGTEALLSEQDSHHLRTVLRLKEGDQLTAVDRASGQEYDAIICKLGEPLTARILGQKEKRAGCSRVKSLIFCLAKGGNTDLVCEKACELGVQHIVLWQSQRSVVRIDNERDAGKKIERWRKIVESAAKQSGNDLIPSISLALNYESLIERVSPLRSPEDRSFICSLSPDSKLPSNTPAPHAYVHLAVGPEGDFTEKEESALVGVGFERLSLGPLVLRCETAAIVAISMIHGAWGFLDQKN
ncbi:MAG: 16S rRNA (uracil(1498)-N(3))-methyltransferase [Deltaproteobacteria bacterium]|nr:16S rRNA (uracil(1498)-N(3))-methyltransferase [Deltaproteobacteria bacterium]